MKEEPIRYLALGDSYTIGQSVSYDQRWPSQLADTLKGLGNTIDTLAYIATTGWRTENLEGGITASQPDSNYNLVSLLIGVNNQYQGIPFSKFAEEFPLLLNWAIALAQGNKQDVFVVSIPDYTYTPFGSDPSTSSELDEYNSYTEQICDSVGVNYYYITDISRRGLIEPNLVASDGLHPSGDQYKEWVEYILEKNVIASIEEKRKDNGVDVFPNPAGEVVNISYQLPKGYGQAELIILDITGKERFRESSFLRSCLVDTSSLEEGVYTYNLVLNDITSLKGIFTVIK